MTHQTNNVIELPYALDVNHFLSALDGANRSALVPHLQLCHVDTGEILCDAGSALPAVYFPVTTAVSVQYTMAGKPTLAVAEIGCEGVVCDDVVGGDSAMPRRVVVYRGGFAYRIDARRFNDACEASPLIRRQIFMRVQVVLAQMSQTLFCSRHHPMQHQLGRWLLIAHDRSRSVEIPITHGMLAQMLGVRRETISDIAQTLQKLGLIRQHRGSIVLTDPTALAHATCGCHRAIRDEAQRILAFGRETRASTECRVHTL
ncbi:Crp/Fnr family transcriptional regulator [Burkholderia multivorans]|uniref:Crp/Fnr family transcriptional regulator n=1 Tax=Burkholderia multivorans TaxID=87883 RepID=UPI001C24130F|nr:Crp/Fnr family transcriptional regulator [Burkholderia multivorans]